MMVIYVPVMFEFDWTNRFRVIVQSVCSPDICGVSLQLAGNISFEVCYICPM